jgi:D-alanyl-lipoteichoic acid acyltransferase DltB (MBOAT superfamily)
MSELLFSKATLFAVIYLITAIAIARSMEVGQKRSIAFACLNIAAVWLIFFGATPSGSGFMLLYIVIFAVFWVLICRFGTAHGGLFLIAFLPPLVLLIFSKTTGVLLLVGLSYMTFRGAHAAWELQLKRIDPMSLPDFLAHIFFMPTFLLGPISPYSYFQSSFNAEKGYTGPARTECLLRILKGAVKVIVIASIFQQIAPENYLADYRKHAAYEYLIAAVGFYVYLYMNFSGLNDVSIGAAGLMGISVKENFNRPYLAQSCTEFWNRWHLSLSEWMRDIAFLPLVAFLLRNARWLKPDHAIAFSLMTVFLLIGWWHGNGWQYWLIGFLYGLAIVTEHYAGKWWKRQKVIPRLPAPPTAVKAARMLYTNLYIAIAVSFMSVDWQAHGLGFAELMRRLSGGVAH